MAFLSREWEPLWLCRLSLMLFLATRLAAQPLDEYSVKAAFLYNFAKFVDWPAEAFRDPGEPFSICVLGEDPFGRALSDVAAGKSVGDRPVSVRRIADAGHTGGCHILFVSSSADKRVLSVFTAAKQPGLLTVGDAGSSTCEGMIIAFTMENGRVRFEINAAAADRTGLRISARLLSLARIRKK
jgi:hypothetical protein